MPTAKAPDLAQTHGPLLVVFFAGIFFLVAGIALLLVRRRQGPQKGASTAKAASAMKSLAIGSLITGVVVVVIPLIFPGGLLYGHLSDWAITIVAWAGVIAFIVVLILFYRARTRGAASTSIRRRESDGWSELEVPGANPGTAGESLDQ